MATKLPFFPPLVFAVIIVLLLGFTVVGIVTNIIAITVIIMIIIVDISISIFIVCYYYLSTLSVSLRVDSGFV